MHFPQIRRFLGRFRRHRDFTMALKLFVEVMSKRSDLVKGVDAGAKLTIGAVGVNRVLQF